MPYNNEYANPYGYGDFIGKNFIEERLKSFNSSPSQGVFAIIDEVETLPIEQNNEKNLNYVLSIDGSLSDVSLETPDVEVGFIKIGVVLEKIGELEKLKKNRFIDNKDYDKCYKTYTLNGVLPGRGIIDTHESTDGKQKLRKEILINMENLNIDPDKTFKEESELTLLDVLEILTPTGKLQVQCQKCKKTSLVAREPIECPHCHRETLHMSDFLKLDEKYSTQSNNSECYSQTMSTFERILMCGLLLKASKNPERFKSIAFLTDGPLALFQSKNLSPLILEFIQSLPIQPILAGFEKTGQFVDFAMSKQVQEKLKAGCLIMVNEDIAQYIAGRIDFSYSGEAFYGRRFIYKTLDGNKTFVFTVPPKQGKPYGSSADVSHKISDYPTVAKIIEVIETTNTDMFGVETAALSSIAMANTTASIPQNFGVTILQNLIENNIDNNDI